MNSKALRIGIFLFLIFQLNGCALFEIEKSTTVADSSYQTDQRVQALEHRVERLEEDMDKVPEDMYYSLF